MGQAMTITWKWGLALVLALGAPVQAVAQDVPGAREAWQMLFGTRGSVSALSGFAGFSPQDRDILDRIGPTQKYYGAIAFSPDEGLVSEATIASANHHSVFVARDLALAECNAKRRAGTAACVIAADIVPQRYEPGRPLQLSIDATFGFGQEYRRARGSKSFAVSPASGKWGWGAGDAAAIAACDAPDCQVVVRD